MDNENVLIIINTGFANATHETESGYTVDEWNELLDYEKNHVIEEVTSDYIEVQAVIDNDDRTIL